MAFALLRARFTSCSLIESVTFMCHSICAQVLCVNSAHILGAEYKHATRLGLAQSRSRGRRVLWFGRPPPYGFASGDSALARKSARALSQGM